MQNQYLQIFKASPMPSLILFPDTPIFTIADVNNAYLEITNTKETDLVGKSIFEVFLDNPGDIVINLRSSFEKILETKQPQKMAEQYYNISVGESMEFEERVAQLENIPVHDNEGKVTTIIHTIKDISHKTLNQKDHHILEDQTLVIKAALKENNTTLNKIMDSSLDVICAVDANGYFLQVSAASEKVWGYKPDELIGKQLFDFVFHEDHEKTKKSAANVMAGNNMTNFENRYIRKDGSLVPITWSARWDAKDQIRYGVARDATEKIKGQTALMESEKKYKNLFENNPFPMLIWEFETLKIIDCNEEALIKYGYNRDEFLQLTIKDIRPFGDVPLLEEVVKTEEDYGRIHKRPWRHKKKNGELMYLEIIGHLMEYNGKSASLLLLNDVTEKLKAEEQKEFEKRDTEALINNTTDGIWSIDCNFKLIAANNAFIQNVEALGGIKLQPGDDVRKNDLLPAEFLAFWVALYRKAFLGEPFKEEIYTPAFNNLMESWAVVSFNPILQDDRVVGIACYARDITGRKKADDALLQSNERYDMVAHATNDCIWDWDLNKNEVIRLGKKLENLLGYDTIDPSNVDEAWSNYVHAEDWARMAKNRKTLFENTRENYWEDEYRFLKPNGQYAYVNDRGYVIRDKEGKAIRMIGASRDITKEKESEIQLLELNDQLHKRAQELAISNLELEQFAYVASHDLQEPLRMVTSFLTLFENKYGNVIDEAGKKYIDFAVDGAKRMRQIILDLLEFSRSGRNEDMLEDVDLNEVVEEIQILFMKKIEEKNAIITVDKLPVINSYKAPIRQVFQNLVSNALKYSRADTVVQINISAKESMTFWEFSIADNGIGISKGYFEKIFNIFQRLHNKEQYSGTGIGLAITKKIIENLGGKIWVESEECNGSTFHFTIKK
jgi:PAS domain S-box-containing protein